MKAAICILLTAAIACVLYYSLEQPPKVREAKEASMLKFLQFSLYEYREKHDQFPRSIEEGIGKGLLDDFPKDRIDYLKKAMSEGRIQYSFVEAGGFRMRLTTCRQREITMDGFPE